MELQVFPFGTTLWSHVILYENVALGYRVWTILQEAVAQSLGETALPIPPDKAAGLRNQWPGQHTWASPRWKLAERKIPYVFPEVSSPVAINSRDYNVVSPSLSDAVFIRPSQITFMNLSLSKYNSFTGRHIEMLYTAWPALHSPVLLFIFLKMDSDMMQSNRKWNKRGRSIVFFSSNPICPSTWTCFLRQQTPGKVWWERTNVTF